MTTKLPLLLTLAFAVSASACAGALPADSAPSPYACVDRSCRHATGLRSLRSDVADLGSAEPRANVPAEKGHQGWKRYSVH